jgi:hypothetical protein
MLRAACCVGTDSDCVLLQICQVLDIPIDEDALRAADGKPNDGTGMEEDGSDEVRTAGNLSFAAVDAASISVCAATFHACAYAFIAVVGQ